MHDSIDGRITLLEPQFCNSVEMAHQGILHIAACCLLMIICSWLYPVSGDSVEDEFSEEVLDLHNKLRHSVETTPTIPGLKWSEDVASVAQAWADECKFGHNPNLHKNGNNLGENIYMSASSSVKKLEQCKFTKGVQSWYDEVEWYDYDSNTCEPGKVCGHYTQLVWRNSTELGCGYKFCPKSSSMSMPWCFLVCDYRPPGNFNGKRPY